MPLRNRRILLLSLVLGFACAVQAARLRHVRDVALVMDYLEGLYVEPVERRQLGYRAIGGMLEGLDPYSSFVSPEEMSQFRSQLEQNFTGLGIVIRKDDDGLIAIERAIPGGPAIEAGLRAGDRIVSIDGVATAELDIQEASNRLRGPLGTSVLLSTLSAGEDVPRRITVTRGVVETPSVVGDRRDGDGRPVYRLQADPRIAYIHLSIFGEQSTREMEEFLTENADDAEAVVIDLRANAGGLLETAKAICDMFLHEGVIVSVEGRLPQERTVLTAEPGVLLDPDKPLVLLVDGDSASASEVVAACLQDQGRAKVAGARSYGKGSVQTVIELDGGRAALRLTTAHWFSPERRKISRPAEPGPEDVWGVDPDEELAVELTDLKRIAVFDRLRRRDAGDLQPAPEAPAALEEPAAETPSNETEGTRTESEPFDLSTLGDAATIERLVVADPTLAEDPQLLRVAAWLQGQMGG